jgi:3-dehydroquinate synthase
MKTVHIDLGDRSYDVLVGFDILPQIGEALAGLGLGDANCAVITNPLVGGLYFDALRDGLVAARPAAVERYDIPDGEEFKTVAEWAGAVQWLAGFADNPAIRPVVLALGGGVIGDMGGFAAACYRRGVPYVQVPTTLLADVDSSIGGKTAVNLPEGKNLVGSFYQPRLVHMDLATLETLDPREVRSGMGEIIKHAAIQDAGMFALLEDTIEDVLALNRNALMEIVPRNLAIKADVVRRDERESGGVRWCLNFGHTLGHAIEKTAAPGALRHGECVAVGMLAAARISVELDLCNSSVPDRLEALVRRAELPASVAGLDPDAVLRRLGHDKKFTTGRNRFVLLEAIGSWTVREAVPEEVVRRAAESVLD